MLCRLQDKGRKEKEEIVEEIREKEGRKREMKESEGTEEITTFPLYPYLLQGQQALPNYKPISVWGPGDKSFRNPSPHPKTTNDSTPMAGLPWLLQTHFSAHGIFFSNTCITK